MDVDYDSNKTIPTLTRNDGIKTAAFVVFCLLASLVAIAITLVVWLAR